MDLGDLGESLAGAAAEGAAEGLISSLPDPPLDPSAPSLPPPPGGDDDDGRSPPPPDQPKRRATVPVVLAIVLAALVAAGGFALISWARGGAACSEGDFESARFGYCATTPAGWIAAAAKEEGIPFDRFLLQDGAATITVTAVPLTKGQDLARFEQFVRGYDEDAGGTTGASSPGEVDGVEAVSFEVALEGPDGVVRSREVLFIREGVAWRVTLADDQVGFEASTRRLDELLESWRFL